MGGRALRSGSACSSDGLGCSEKIVEEEEGECSAPKCLQPVAEQISWVQCDVCQQWFHLVCLGLSKEYVERIDTYSCVSCRVPSVRTILTQGITNVGQASLPQDKT